MRSKHRRYCRVAVSTESGEVFCDVVIALEPRHRRFPITKPLSRCSCRCCRHKHSTSIFSFLLACFSLGPSLVACFYLSTRRSPFWLSTVLSSIFLLFPRFIFVPIFSREFLRDVRLFRPRRLVRLPLASLHSREQHRRRLPRVDTREKGGWENPPSASSILRKIAVNVVAARKESK